MPIVEIKTTNHDYYYHDWYYPNTDYKIPNKNFVKLPDYYSFDLENLRYDIKQIESKYGYRPFAIKKDSSKVRRTYQGIGLTSRPGAQDPIYDALKLFDDSNEIDAFDFFASQKNTNYNNLYKNLSEKSFGIPTEACTDYILSIMTRFKSPITKARILNLKPKGVILPHVDFPFYKQIRVHASIFSNDNTWWEVDGERFQIPCDGNFYWFDTGKYHAVWNDGKTDRIDFNINLSVYHDRNGNLIQEKNSDIIDLISDCKI